MPAKNVLTTDLADFQNSNCARCFYADAKKVGTGKPCCTYINKPVVDEGKCLSLRAKK